MPEEVRKKALAEAKKLETGGPHNHEGGMLRNYLDLMLDLPWVTEEKKDIDIAEARRALESHHNGLEKVKERIVQHLAVMKLKGEKQGSICCSPARPARARRASGVPSPRPSAGKSRPDQPRRRPRRGRDPRPPPDLRRGSARADHPGQPPGRHQEPGLRPGRGRQAGRRIPGRPGERAPRGPRSRAERRVLGPLPRGPVRPLGRALHRDGQLARDDPGPAPRPDGVLIEITGYTKNEKFAIAKYDLVPEVLTEHGLDVDRLRFEDEALRAIIDRYTREAGVRQLKKQLAKAARHVSEKIVSGTPELPFVVTPESLTAVLARSRSGSRWREGDRARRRDRPGLDPRGRRDPLHRGDGHARDGQSTLTGQLGDVMKESATISLSLIRSRLADPQSGFNFMTCDTHIHVPAGATPKDGPSAGVGLFTALASLITGRTVDPELAMTGEMTLSGAVMPVGGIKEKVLAAHRAGIKR